VSAKTRRLSLFVVVSALITYMVQSIPQGVSPVLATLMRWWPDVSESNVVLLATIIGIAALPTALLSNTISRKLGLKLTLIIGLVVCIVAGSLPTFIAMGYEGVLITRIVQGLGYGLVFPLGAVVITYYFPDLTQRGKVLGWAASTSTLAGVVFAVGSGYLVTIGDGNLVWLVNLLMVVSLVFAIVMPAPEKYSKRQADESAAEVVGPAAEAVAEPEAGVTAKIGKGWFFIVASFVFMVFAYAFSLFISSAIMNDGLGGSVEAGYAVMFFNVGGILGGILFPLVSGKIKDNILGVGLLTLCLGYLGLALAMNIILIYACMMLIGIGFLGSFTYIIMGCTVWIPGPVLARGMGIQMCVNQMGNFTAGYMFPALASLFGQAGNARFGFYLSVLVFSVGGVFFLIRPRRVVTQRQEAA
jgi:MFS family permease